MFRENDKIRLKDRPDQVLHVITTREFGDIWFVKVRDEAGRLRWFPVDLVERWPADEGNTPIEFMSNGTWVPYDRFAWAVGQQWLRKPPSDGLFSIGASRVKFLPFQFKSVLKLLENVDHRILIADEVGLGKTIQAGLILVELSARQELRSVFILCPASLQLKWQMEMQHKFGEYFDIWGSKEFRSWLDSVVESGELKPARAIVSLQMARSREFVGGMERVGEKMEWQPGLLERAGETVNPLFELVIIDEAHHMRNSKTLQNRLGRLVGRFSDAVVMLTATPLHTGRENLFNLLHIMDPQEFDNFENFERFEKLNRYVVKAEAALQAKDLQKCEEELEQLKGRDYQKRFTSSPFYGSALREVKEYQRSGNTRSLRNAISALGNLNYYGHLVTRTQKRHSGLPRIERRAEKIQITLSSKELEFYRAVLETLSTVEVKIKKEDHMIRLPIDPQILCILSYERQMASSIPGFIEKRIEESDTYDDLDDEAEDEFWQASVTDMSGQILKILKKYKHMRDNDSKYLKLTEKLSEIPCAKVLLFAQFKATARYLTERLNSDGYQSLVMTGDTPKEDREELIERFRTDEDLRVLVMTEVGTEGIDLQFCNTVVNYDLPWNPMRIEQRIGRVDRIAQEKNHVNIINLVVKGTIDERVLIRLYERIRLFEESIGPLEPILDVQLKDLRADVGRFIKQRAGDKEYEEAVEKTICSLEERRMEIEEAEKRAVKLLAWDHFLIEEVNRIKRSNRYVTPEFLSRLVHLFLRKHYKRSWLQESDEGLYYLHLDEDFLADFRNSAPQRDYVELVHRMRNRRILITFDPEVAFDRPESEYVGQRHPVIRFIAKKQKEEPEIGAPQVEVVCSSVPEGLYVYGIYVFHISGYKKETQIEAVFVDTETKKLLPAKDSAKLFDCMLSQGDSPNRYYKVDVERLRLCWKLIEEQEQVLLNQVQGELNRFNQTFLKKKEVMLTQYFDEKINRLKSRMEGQEEKVARMTRGKIEKLEQQKRAAMERLAGKNAKVEELRCLLGGVVSVRRRAR